MYVYCMYARKGASEAPRTHFRACKIAKHFLGACPQIPPHTIYSISPTFCICPGPPQSSRWPCLCDYCSIHLCHANTNQLHTLHSSIVKQLYANVHFHTYICVCNLRWDSPRAHIICLMLKCSALTNHMLTVKCISWLANVAVPGRNGTLFCCVFIPHYCVRSAAAQNICKERGLYVQSRCMNTW